MNERAEPILAAVDLLAPAFVDAGLDELELSVGDLHVRLARPRAVAVPARPTGGPRSAARRAPDRRPDAVRRAGAGHALRERPLTGVWYPAPSPGARPYVNEGDECPPARSSA